MLTGAAMPAGADTALMQEDVELDGDVVVIPPGVKRGANRRRAGEDVRAGQVALQPGTRLRPQDVGVAATLGRATLEVYRPLEVALLSTGDELREPGAPLEPGATYDANRTILSGLLRGLGCRVTDFGILADRAEAVTEALRRASADYDAVITSGGVSRGDEDHVVRTVERLGQLHFWQIAVKPGRPLAFGRLGRAVFIGLPGNPVAAVICFLRFARPLLVALGGGRWPEPRAFLVPAGFVMKKKPDRREYLRARLVARPGRPDRGAADRARRLGHPDLAGRGRRPGRGGRGHDAHRAGRSGRIRAVQRVRRARLIAGVARRHNVLLSLCAASSPAGHRGRRRRARR